MECAIYVFSHAACIAAYVEGGSVLEPIPQLGRVFLHPVLHIHFFLLVSGESCIQSCDVSVSEHRLQLLAVEKVGSSTAFSEEQPVLAFCPKLAALMQKSSEWRNPGTGTDHDHGSVRVRGEAELLIRLDINRPSLAERRAVRE